ncbi:glycosyltransferase family 2 protein [Pantoea stewartii]|uniref:glycosyltransferase family 2 protein n=1 Tax=Pantoea stewartii TaxID=66269 RepID=UPI0021E8EC8C|nr:glycosyltransferase family 2 protein [Pantoea stewartii]UYK98015.1 glycosyltransferase family 2 protein [Pantoea stewartii]
MSNKKPITVIVLSYNSESTIVETFDSILSQSFGPENINLIISDDGSQDKSKLIINKWLEKNGEHFNKVVRNFNAENLGIVKNFNSALLLVETEWMKLIAGDDILLPHCLAVNHELTKKNNNKVFFSKMKAFKKIDNENIYFNELPDKKQQLVLSQDLKKQQLYLRTENFAVAPTTFIHMDVIREVGYLDENYFLLDDYPLWVKLSLKGFSFNFIDDVTVLYRIGESASNTSKQIINKLIMTDLIKFELDKCEIYKDNKINKIRSSVWAKVYPSLVNFFGNKKNVVSKTTIITFNFIFKVGYLRNKLFS